MTTQYKKMQKVLRKRDKIAFIPDRVILAKLFLKYKSFDVWNALIIDQALPVF